MPCYCPVYAAETGSWDPDTKRFLVFLVFPDFPDFSWLGVYGVWTVVPPLILRGFPRLSDRRDQPGPTPSVPNNRHSSLPCSFVDVPYGGFWVLNRTGPGTPPSPMWSRTGSWEGTGDEGRSHIDETHPPRSSDRRNDPTDPPLHGIDICGPSVSLGRHTLTRPTVVLDVRVLLLECLSHIHVCRSSVPVYTSYKCTGQRTRRRVQGVTGVPRLRVSYVTSLRVMTTHG